MELKAGYKQTKVGIIPVDWEVKPISQIAPLQRGFDLPSSKLKEGIYPVVYSNGIMNYHNASMVRSPGVVTGRSGTLGKVHYVENDFWPHNTSLWVTHFYNNSPKFIYYLYSYIGFERFSSGSGVPTLNRNDAHEFKVSIPSTTAEQEAIAEALSNADALIEALEGLLAKKRQVKQGAMQQLLTPPSAAGQAGKRRLPGFSGEWNEKKVPEICWFQEGPGVRTWQFTSSGIKLLNGTNIFRSNISLDNTDRFISEKLAYGQYAHFLADAGDIVIASSGITIEKFDEKVAFVRDEHLPLCMNTSTIRFKANKNVLHSSYLYYLLMSGSFKRQIGYQATGSAQLNFGPAHIEKVSFHLPDLKEQTAIADILSDMDAEIDALEEKFVKVRQVKQGMMQELLTGRIRLV